MGGAYSPFLIERKCPDKKGNALRAEGKLLDAQGEYTPLYHLRLYGCPYLILRVTPRRAALSTCPFFAPLALAAVYKNGVQKGGSEEKGCSFLSSRVLQPVNAALCMDNTEKDPLRHCL